ncbi:MAG: short-chain dehydrogenase [Deltaproteobacteria bacterium]|nr:short-chain dehydrogenase [Deltaproteobacteria bacterium]
MSGSTGNVLDAFRLDDRVAIVTGSGRGIGAETAKVFAEVGARVVCVARTAEQIEATVAQIESVGGEGLAVACDLTDPEAGDRVVAATVERFGGVDLLVNNAGGGGHMPTKYAADEHFEAAIGLNFRAPFYLTRAVAPHMKARGDGAVVNISSGFSRAANVGSIPYGGAKAALEQMTRMMAMEYAPEVRVNAIRVGAVTTENMRENLLARNPGIGEKLEAWTPRARLGEPRDIALAALYLCSPAADYVTARILPVDGGVVLERSATEIIDRAERLAEEGAAERSEP